MNKQMLQTAVNVARLAGDRLNGISARRVNSDAGRDIKLQEDVESEMFIRQLLSSTGIPVIGEECGGDVSVVESGEPYWVVDPIDGTYNFLRGMPGVCVSIGLMRGWQPVVGAVYDFTRGEIFAGGDGLAFTINAREVRPSWASEKSQAVLMAGFPHAADIEADNLKRFLVRASEFKKVRMTGSAAVSLAWLAAGRADCYAERGLYLWDVAGGIALLKSLGCPYKMRQLGGGENPLRIEICAAAKDEFLF